MFSTPPCRVTNDLPLYGYEMPADYVERVIPLLCFSTRKQFFRSQPELCPKNISGALQTKVKGNHPWQGGCSGRRGGNTLCTPFGFFDQEHTAKSGVTPRRAIPVYRFTGSMSCRWCGVEFIASVIRVRELVLLFQPALCCLFFIQTPRASACGGLFQDEQPGEIGNSPRDKTGATSGWH